MKEKEVYVIKKGWFQKSLTDFSFLFAIVLLGMYLYAYLRSSTIILLIAFALFFGGLYHFIIYRINSWKDEKPMLIINKDEIQIHEKGVEMRKHSWKDIQTVMETKLAFGNGGMNYMDLKIFSKKDKILIDTIVLGDYNIETHEMQNIVCQFTGSLPQNKLTL